MAGEREGCTCQERAAGPLFLIWGSSPSSVERGGGRIRVDGTGATCSPSSDGPLPPVGPTPSSLTGSSPALRHSSAGVPGTDGGGREKQMTPHNEPPRPLWPPIKGSHESVSHPLPGRRAVSSGRPAAAKRGSRPCTGQPPCAWERLTRPGAEASKRAAVLRRSRP